MKTKLFILAACLLGLLSTIGASLPYPILPPLFAAEVSNGLNQFLGLPPKLLFSLALLINPLGLLIGSALLGPLSDRYGRRPVLIVTAIGAAAGHAITALSLVVQSYPLFIVARFVTGLLEGNGAVARAMLADRLEGEQRVRAMSWLNGAFWLGWLAGPLLAGLTLAWGVTVPFLVATLALLLVAVLVAFTLPVEAASTSTTSWWHIARNRHALNLLKHAELRTLFYVQLAYTCGVTAFYEYYPLWLVEAAHYDAKGIALVTALLCGLMTATSLVAEHASRWDPLRCAAWSAFAAASAIALVASGHVHIGLVAIVLFGIPNAVYNGVVPAWCADRFGEHGNGAVMGLLSTIFCVANILMAAAGSFLTLIDTRLILLLGAVLAASAGWRYLHWQARLGLASGAVQ